MGSVFDFFLDAMQKGGVFMWPILACAIIAAGITTERLFYVMFRANLNSAAFFAQIQKLILANNVDRAIKLCHAEPNAALSRALKAALTRANRSESEIQAAAEEAVLEVFPQLTRRTGYLSMLANVATLLGLLGTIQGLIQAFDAVAHASAETKAALLASGIAVAMYTTAAGLLVAIPTLVLSSVIVNQTTRIQDDVDQFAFKVVNLLLARRRGSQEREGGAADAAE